MVTRFGLIALLLCSSCTSFEGRPPTKEEFDPAGASARPAGEAPPPSNKDSEAIFERYEKRMAEGLPITAGDDLRFTVLGQADLSFEARVPLEGTLQYPMIGELVLAGRSVRQVREEIKQRLEKDYLVQAEVSVLVKEYARRRVYVLGGVARPTELELPAGQSMSLLQSIAHAGGFREDAARHGIMILRKRDDGKPGRLSIPFSVVALEGGKGKDPLLVPDDIVLVPSLEKIYVLGEVARPGAFPADTSHGMTASQAIALAGGYTKVANESNVRLVRRSKQGTRSTYVLNLASVVAGSPENDVPLQPGDLLYVPESIF